MKLLPPLLLVSLSTLTTTLTILTTLTTPALPSPAGPSCFKAQQHHGDITCNTHANSLPITIIQQLSAQLKSDKTAPMREQTHEGGGVNCVSVASLGDVVNVWLCATSPVRWEAWCIGEEIVRIVEGCMVESGGVERAGGYVRYYDWGKIML